MCVGVKEEFEMVWVGWVGVTVPDTIGQESLKKALAAKRCIPVFLNDKMEKEFYNGYSNNVLWPLFHNLGIPTPPDLASVISITSHFDTYKEVNQIFANVVNEYIKEGEVVWCHDYHLMLFPEYLKKLNNKVKVGWFLHTAFPSFETYRALPSRKEMLEGVTAADVIGFQIDGYVWNFVCTCERIIQLERVNEGLRDKQGRFTRVLVCPIGIDPWKFIHGLDDKLTQNAFQELEDKRLDNRLILGIDRLDPIKGIPHKLLAFRKFLDDNSDLCNKVKLFQICVPSREDVPMYKELRHIVNEINGEIGGSFDRIYTGGPLIVRHNPLPSHKLNAALIHADVLVITSLSDGMNLVSLEYVAAQAARKGVLIISEFAGAAEVLHGAIKINPNDVGAVALAIKQALNMSREERESRHDTNFRYVTACTSQRWVQTFLERLMEESSDDIQIVDGNKPIRQRAEKLAYVNDNLRRLLSKGL